MSFRSRPFFFAWPCALLLCAAILLLPAGCAPAAPAAPTAAPAFTAVPSPTPEPSEPSPDPAMLPVTYAWISDTQMYAARYPETFLAMTRWIVDHRQEWNIQYVLHTGDFVNNMLKRAEWQAAEDAMDAFVGELPVFAVSGNHDIQGYVHDYSGFSALMERQRYKEYPTFGEQDADGRRRYDLVTIGNDPFLLIGIGFFIMPSDVEWLDRVLSEFPDRTAILLAHQYLEADGPQQGKDEMQLFRVAARHPNVRYVFCGHMHALRRVAQAFDDDLDGTPDRVVQAIMADYQGFPNGGDGYIVLLTFDPLEREIRVTSYSPVLDDFNCSADESAETYILPLATVGDNPAKD